MSANCEECCICLTSITPCLRQTTMCNHQFHNDCITKWLTKHIKCPLCRTVLIDNRQESDGEEDSDDFGVRWWENYDDDDSDDTEDEDDQLFEADFDYDQEATELPVVCTECQRLVTEGE